MQAETKSPSEMEEYLFDLRGYLSLPGAIDAEHVARLNELVDSYMDLQPGQWRGWVRRAPNPSTVHHLHQVFEMGAACEQLIDHPAWIDHMRRFIGPHDGLFIDESFVDVRGPGDATRLHSGAHKRRIRTQYRYHEDQFRCGQINILLALTDVGPGDGATMVIPASHKSNRVHPAFGDERGNESMEDVDASIEVHLQAGDALLFVDAMAHGSARRVNPGERRIAIIRYGPEWGSDRYGYQPSPGLLQRLTPERRRILQPVPPVVPPDESRT